MHVTMKKISQRPTVLVSNQIQSDDQSRVLLAFQFCYVIILKSGKKNNRKLYSLLELTLKRRKAGPSSHAFFLEYIQLTRDFSGQVA